ncbi:hypothetical protein FB451DRAFT_1369300 [Mycena latifolia]|nr:hypothetical protein FB451DRAFT_1369300 [Mycena latifolia]
MRAELDKLSSPPAHPHPHNAHVPIQAQLPRFHTAHVPGAAPCAAYGRFAHRESYLAQRVLPSRAPPMRAAAAPARADLRHGTIRRPALGRFAHLLRAARLRAFARLSVHLRRHQRADTPHVAQVRGSDAPRIICVWRSSPACSALSSTPAATCGAAYTVARDHQLSICGHASRRRDGVTPGGARARSIRTTSGETSWRQYRPAETIQARRAFLCGREASMNASFVGRRRTALSSRRAAAPARPRVVATRLLFSDAHKATAAPPWIAQYDSSGWRVSDSSHRLARQSELSDTRMVPNEPSATEDLLGVRATSVDSASAACAKFPID